MTLGCGPLAVPGTLSLPQGPGPHPAWCCSAVRDQRTATSTIGRSKPLKDLAWGLASRGVAVLRFDKVTHAHPDLVARTAPSPWPTSTCPTPSRRSPCCGAPRHQRRAGLRGGPQPRRHRRPPRRRGRAVGRRAGHPGRRRPAAAVGGGPPDQLPGFAGPATAAASQPAIDALTAQARMVDSPDLSTETPDAGCRSACPRRTGSTFAATTRSRSPRPAPADAHPSGRPRLPGDRGRRPRRWRAVLDQRPGVAIRVYQADNHFFFPGTGPSSPAESRPRSTSTPRSSPTSATG